MKTFSKIALSILCLGSLSLQGSWFGRSSKQTLRGQKLMVKTYMLSAGLETYMLGVGLETYMLGVGLAGIIEPVKNELDEKKICSAFEKSIIPGFICIINAAEMSPTLFEKQIRQSKSEVKEILRAMAESTPEACQAFSLLLFDTFDKANEAQEIILRAAA